MKLNVFDELRRAKRAGILDKINNDDPSLTYEQFFLYYILRVCYGSADETTMIDPDKEYALQKEGWVDETWLTMKGSKLHRMAIETPWDKVFDK